VTATIDTLSPTFAGEDRIGLALAPDSEPLLPWIPVTVDVTYEDADPEGIALPLVFTVQPMGEKGGAAQGYKRDTLRITAPTALTFTVPAAGQYLVTLKEWMHNRWQGRLVITVEGDSFGDDIVRERS
jgi:hypothetical protein